MAGGQGFTSTAGSIATLAVTVALFGSAITSASGAISANNSGTVALTGSSVSVQQQTIAPSWGQALTGSAITSARGTVTVSLRPTDIVGQAITTTTGTVTASGSSGVTAHLSGVEITSSAGDLEGGTQAISGSAITSAAGTAVPVFTFQLSGIGLTCSQGTTAPEQQAVDTYIESSIGSVAGAISVALSGSSVATEQGTIGITGDAEIALTGESVTTSAGTIGIEESYPITGVDIAAQQYNVGAPGGASLTGSEVTATAGTIHTDDDRAYALTGVSITAQDGVTFASSLAFPAGQELIVSAQDIGPRVVELAGISVGVDQGITGPPPVVVVDSPGGGYYWNPPKRKRRHIEEIEPVSIEKVEETLSRVSASLEAKRALRKAQAKDKAVTEEIRRLLDQQDALKQGIANIKPKNTDDDDIAVILALALSR